ncbi:MAG TPA: thermosome subunit [Candidatus Methanoperedenaceae archaeon]|nr:thermosome subunit [Candidatus Methanoperedenaceae archaeon]
MQGGQPILVLREGTRRTRGRDAQSNNIMAAKAVAAAVRTTLGPKGMDKMLVNGDSVLITNDGVTILREMDIEHPAAKMIVDVSKTQDDEVGDGTTTAAVIAGELLDKAQELIEQDIHPSLIIDGYRLASDKAVEVLGTLAKDVGNDDEALRNIAITAITGKGLELSRDKLADIAVRAIKAVAEDEDGRTVADINNIKTVKKFGASLDASELISGMVLDKEVVHPAMPKKIKDAKIALISTPIEFSKTEVDAEIKITSPEQMQEFLDEEEKLLKSIVGKIVDSGANVVLCEKGIEDIAQYYLAKAGILALRRLTRSDIEKTAIATGASLVTNIEDLAADDLGYAREVEERKIGAEKMTFITGCRNPKAVTVLLRGGSEHVVDTVDKAMEDALRAVGVAIEDRKLVAGGGAPELEVALKLREFASTLRGREQLAVQKFADAVEVIPKTLAENAGLDPIDMLLELRSRHESGSSTTGLDVFEGKPVDMWKRGVIEPLRVKTQSINSATEAAIMILRIDDVIAASTKQPAGGAGGACGPGGAPCGMGGMGGMPGMGMPPGMMM